ncbi:MAG: translesion error-prone DNA polymerase V autoproteolytic subunit [Bifidobacteriaceae bacterium]|jgi:DNA polymerase V|nr:translesion error-prone DNA polymerase V autoproteolytic subunit [Bifidobacteriaceae bacterium]
MHPQSIANVETAEIPAGWPSPAQDYASVRIDLNEHLIKDPTSTYLLRMRGDAMNGVGIFSGDEILVDRSLDPSSNDIVVAVVDDQFTVRRLLLEKRGSNTVALLIAANPKYPPYRVAELTELKIWGVVTKTLHTPK